MLLNAIVSKTFYGKVATIATVTLVTFCPEGSRKSEK